MNPLSDPLETFEIPSITTASDTLPTVAVSVAVPTPFTVTSPSLSTEKTSSLLLVHISDFSLSSGDTIAVTLRLVPTGIAVFSKRISTDVSSFDIYSSCSCDGFKLILLTLTSADCSFLSSDLLNDIIRTITSTNTKTIPTNTITGVRFIFIFLFFIIFLIKILYSSSINNITIQSTCKRKNG